MQSVHPDLFIPVTLIGTIDFYHFIPLLMTTFPGGHKVRAKQNLLASFYPNFSSDPNGIWCSDEAIWAEYSDTFLSKIC